MSQPVIEISKLSKRYIIGHQRERGDGLRHAIERALTRPREWFGKGRSTSREEFWALRDVNVAIQQGDVLGIIGRNGAGKSTLLKILSRITEPTFGRIRLRGRVASLLEVGTGFHPELTGRENIFLNGAILGMSGGEIRRKFDEIVAFAEIERFLDTPVKRYSSGMYVRLAFAVAAHLEPEILIVDEVLAVGDAEFQRKSLGKMSEVAHGGRTVIFVSHNISAIMALTNRCVYLASGTVAFDGPTAEAVKHYTRRFDSVGPTYRAVKRDKVHQVMAIEIPSLATKGVHVAGSPLRIRVIVRSQAPTRHGCLSIQIINASFQSVLHIRAHDHETFFGREAGESVLECEIPECWLNVGRYSLRVWVTEPPGGEVYEVLEAVCPFDVEVCNGSALWGWRAEACCYIVPERWTCEAGRVDSGEGLAIGGAGVGRT